MKNSNESSLGDAINQFMKQSGLDKKSKVKRVQQEWERIMGKPVAENTRKKWLDEQTGVFYIEMTNPVWKAELNMARGRIKDLLNKELEEDRISEVRIL